MCNVSAQDPRLRGLGLPFVAWLHDRHQQGRKLAAGGPGNRLFVPGASSFAACVSFIIIYTQCKQAWNGTPFVFWLTLCSPEHVQVPLATSGASFATRL